MTIYDSWAGFHQPSWFSATLSFGKASHHVLRPSRRGSRVKGVRPLATNWRATQRHIHVAGETLRAKPIADEITVASVKTCVYLESPRFMLLKLWKTRNAALEPIVLPFQTEQNYKLIQKRWREWRLGGKLMSMNWRIPETTCSSFHWRELSQRSRYWSGREQGMTLVTQHCSSYCEHWSGSEIKTSIIHHSSPYKLNSK